VALSDTSKINISIKKLSGKAQTSNDKDLANEGLPTGLTLSAETIFGDQIPSAPNSSAYYTITEGVAEYLRLSASFIPGTDTSSGRHAFALQLPDDYESQSSNPKKGAYPFLNKQVVYITSGSLQLIPTAFATGYEGKPYHTGSGETAIPVLDARDWNLDYFNGIFFQQDPPATGDSNQNPRYIDAFLYIGASVKDKTASSGGGDPNAQYLVLSATGSLPNERVFTTGLGLSASDGGAGSAYTVAIRDSIVATLTGSQFSGNVGITGSFGVTSTSIFGTGSSLSGEDNNFFVSGAIGSRGTAIRGLSVFGGDLFSSGTLFAPSGLSGSLTRLIDGSSYLVAGSGINITSSSNGSITVAAGASGRLKFNKVITSNISSGDDCDVSANFSAASYSFNRVDIFVNGQLLYSGSQNDYLLNTSKTGSIHFNFDLFKDDVVTSIIND